MIPPDFIDIIEGNSLDIVDPGPSWPDPDEFDMSSSSSYPPTADLERVVSPAEEEQVSSVDVTIIIVATASVVLVVLAIVAVLLYKVSQFDIYSLI